VNAGTVTFQVKTTGTTPTNVGTAVTSGTVVNGVASVAYNLPSSAPVGSYTIVATYNPSTNFTGSTGSGTLTLTPRTGVVAYIGQTVFVASGSSSTTAQVTLTASVADPTGFGDVFNSTVTFKDLLTGKILATGVKVSPVSNTDRATGTANTVVTLSTGQYGSQMYLIEVSLDGSFTNTQQTTAPAGSDPYNATHPTVVAMIPTVLNTVQGASTITNLGTAAGTYANASPVTYSVGLKFNNGGTNPQGQIQLVLQRSDGIYYVKSNSISSVAFSGACNKDVTVYTKASIYKVNNGVLTSIDGGVTLRMDAHDGDKTTGSTCTPMPLGTDTVGFTVLSTKTSALYYSNQWVYDSKTLSWRTIPQSISGPSGVVTF
jgi:hypothetical protein